MVKLDKEELLKLAELSALKLYDEEVEDLLEQIKVFLEYTDELDQVQLSKEVAPIRNVNVFREDIALPTNSKPILEQAPQTKDTYFEVPKILD